MTDLLSRAAGLPSPASIGQIETANRLDAGLRRHDEQLKVPLRVTS